MSDGELACDVVIIGGGLVGGMASTLLQKEGLRTLVLEARPQDRPDKIVVGEALTEGTSVFLRHELGLTDWLKAHAFRKFGFDFLTLPRQGPAPRRFEDCHELLLSLKPLESTPAALRRLIPTYHVDRPPLNRHLAERARATGAGWRYGASVEHVDLSEGAPGGAITVHFREKGGEPEQLRCRFVLDCSGRRTLLGRQLGITRPVAGLNTAATWNRFRNVGADPAVWSSFGGVDRRRHTIHCCGPGFWIWWIHQSDEMTSVGVSYDRDQHWPDVKAEDRGFAEMIEKFPPVAEQLKTAQALEPYQHYAHLAYESDHWVNPRGYALIGDAGWFTDALYSVGIETACRQLANLTPLVIDCCRGAAIDRSTYERLNEEFIYTRKSVQKMNEFKYKHGWARPHVVAQTAVYELGDIQELYNLQDRSQWTREGRDRHYHLPWYNQDRYQRLSGFLDNSLLDGERDLIPGAPLLKKALLPGPEVYLATWPLWRLRRGPALFFKIIRLWSFSERLTQRHRLWPDGLGWMARLRKRPMLTAGTKAKQNALPEPARVKSSGS